MYLQISTHDIIETKQVGEILILVSGNLFTLSKMHFLSFFLLLLWFFISLLVFSDSTHKCFFPLILSHPRLLFRLLLLSFCNFTADLFDRVVYFYCLYFLTVNSLFNLLQSIFLCPQYFEDSALSESYVNSILGSFTCIISLESSLKKSFIYFLHSSFSETTDIFPNYALSDTWMSLMFHHLDESISESRYLKI